MPTGDPPFGGAQWPACPCNTISDFQQQCPYHMPHWPQTYTTTTLALPLWPQRLSDEDVERIAKRVAELIKPKRSKRAK